MCCLVCITLQKQKGIVLSSLCDVIFVHGTLQSVSGGHIFKECTFSLIMTLQS